MTNTKQSKQARTTEPQRRKPLRAAAGPAYLRVIVETQDSRLEMDTRCGNANFVEARATEAIRQGCVGLLIATPDEKVSRP